MAALAVVHVQVHSVTCTPKIGSACTLRKQARFRRMAVSNSQAATTNVGSLVEFLKQDLPHLFDEQGIDSSQYEERVLFRDPLNKYDTLRGYLFNLRLLRTVFKADFFLHLAKQTGPSEISTRWTMRMTFKLLPWKPVLIFTGISVMGINMDTGKFCSHVDYWDSIENNEFFSLEALKDVVKQMRPMKTPDLETPKYMVVKRTANYEIREYESFLIAESRTEGVASSEGFNDVAGYIFGKNQREEKMKMTTPVFNERTADADKIQFVLPSKYDISKLPLPNSEQVKLRQVDKAYAAAIKFSGETSDSLVEEKESQLRSHLLKDKLKPTQGYLLARYNDPDSTPAPLRRNEVIIWLDDFKLEL